MVRNDSTRNGSRTIRNRRSLGATTELAATQRNDRPWGHLA
jgi:hypothetical protein